MVPLFWENCLVGLVKSIVNGANRERYSCSRPTLAERYPDIKVIASTSVSPGASRSVVLVLSRHGHGSQIRQLMTARADEKAL